MGRRWWWLRLACWMGLALPVVGWCAAPDVPVVEGTSFGRAVELTHCWLAKVGDDPAWAEAGYDDRGWAQFESARSLKGQGLADARAKTLWLRCHVQVRAGGEPAMELFLQNINTDYELFVNGVEVGERGAPGMGRAKRPHPQWAYPVPAEVVRDAPGGALVVAIRFHAGPVGFVGAPYEKDSGVWLVGPVEALLRRNEVLAHEWGAPLVISGMYLLVGVCGLVIWWSLREQKEYLALAVWTLSGGLIGVFNFLSRQRMEGPAGPLDLLAVLFAMVSSVGLLEFVRRLLQMRWSRLWWVLEAAVALARTMVPLVNTGLLPLPVAAVAYYVPLAVNIVVLGWLLVRGARQGNRDAPYMLLPILLWSLDALYRVAGVVLFFLTKRPVPELPGLQFAGYAVSSTEVADVVGLLCLVLIILKRTIRLSEEKADLAGEVAAAEQLQLLLLARASRATPGYAVETVYRPMQQVGGDFFLVQPCEEDGSLVAILGDVSGKGLQAAMRVAMILGVLQREAMGEPERVLERLNRALVAQNEFGFTTACCIRVERDGRFCFANAGHLNPYVGGQELASEGALPLGMDAEASYPVACGRLARGERMVLLSDGVPEARNKAGELFGFARVLGVSGWSAEEIAAAAQRFGQEDDITVLAVRVM